MRWRRPRICTPGEGPALRPSNWRHVGRASGAPTVRRRGRPMSFARFPRRRRSPVPPTARPTTGVSNNLRGSTMGRSSRATRKILVASTAAARPMPTAQRNSAPVGDPVWGICGMLNEKVPNPVRWSRPTKTSDPTPAASRPGNSTISMVGPPSPTTSMSRKAPTRGEPRSVAIAAKLPAPPMTTLAIAGASRLARCTASTPSPLPMAISGASGPSTTPRLRVANDAATMPKRSIGLTGPPA